MANGMEGGLLGMIAPEDRERIAMNTFGQIGALLLAAGQKQMPQQRAQYLAQLGNVGQNIESNIYRTQQARLMNAQMQDRMREMDELKVIGQTQRDNPEMLAKQLGQDIETIRMASPAALREAARARVIQTPEQRELQQLNLQQARQNLAIGRIINVGNEVYQLGADGSMKRLTAPRDLGMGEGGGQPQAEGAPESAATLSPNLDYSRAFSWKGAGNFLSGKGQGLFSGQTKETAEATKAIADINSLNNSLISSTSAEVAGKNLKLTQMRITDLLPEPGGGAPGKLGVAALFTSPQDAVNKYSAIRSLIESDMKDLEVLAGERSPASASDKVKAAQAWRDLRRNRDNLNVVISSLSKTAETEVPGQQQTAPRQQAPSLQEGTIIRNPSTGQRKVLRNGKWEDM